MTSDRSCDPRSNEKSIANDADSPDADLSLSERSRTLARVVETYHYDESDSRYYMHGEMNTDLICHELVLTNKHRCRFPVEYIDVFSYHSFATITI